MPGGAVEAEESPHAACRREVAEELGLDRLPRRVLAVDWVPSRPERPEGLIVVYDGGVLSDAEVKEIVLADGELAGFAFIPPDEVAGLDAAAGPAGGVVPRRGGGGHGRGPGERQSRFLTSWQRPPGVRPAQVPWSFPIASPGLGAWLCLPWWSWRGW